MTDRIRLTEENRRWWTLAAMCFALFMIMLDNTVVNVALPSIQADLDTTIASLEWTVNAYTLTFAVLLVTGGRLGDIFGRRRMFLFGVLVFALSSAAIGLAPDQNWLVAGRAVQGIGAAFMMPATLSIITNAFPPEMRGKAIGTWAGVSGLALAIGPVVGGFLTEHVSWRAIFFLNLPVAAGAVAVTLFATRESRDETVERRIDIPGIAALSIGLTSLVLALIEGNSWGWGSPEIVTLLAVAAVALVSFGVIELRSRLPMVDFAFFRSQSFVGANVVAFAISFAMLAVFFFVALYMQNILGYSPLEAGVRFLPSTVLIIVTAPIAGRLADRIGPRRLIVTGLLLLAVSLYIQTHITVDSGYGLLLAAFMVMGVGIGLTMSPMSTAAMNAVEVTKAGVASGILSMSRMVGGTFGVAAIGALFQGVTRDDLAPEARLPPRRPAREARRGGGLLGHQGHRAPGGPGGGAPDRRRRRRVVHPRALDRHVVVLRRHDHRRRSGGGPDRPAPGTGRGSAAHARRSRCLTHSQRYDPSPLQGPRRNRQQMAVDTTNVAQVSTEPGELPETMAAWVIREEREGEPTDAFQIEEIEVPQPGAFEVIVRVMAAGVNYNNVWAALGKPVSVMRYGDHPEYGHHIGGSDASGIVWKVGAGVTRWKPGDEVVIHCNQASYEDPEVHGLDPLAAPSQMIWGYETTWGSFAQFTKVQAQQLLPKPQNLTWEEAASYGLTYFTAYRMLITRCNMQAGARVLIWGAAGGLGVFATQLCKLTGAKAVGVVSSPEKGKLLEQMGIEGWIDRNEFKGMMRTGNETPEEEKARFKVSREFSKKVKEILGDAPDIVFEHVGPGDVPDLGLHREAVRQGRDLRGHHGLQPRLRRALPVDAPEGDRRLALRQRVRVHEGERADRVRRDPAGAVADDALRGRRRGAPADEGEQAPRQDLDPRRRR